MAKANEIRFMVTSICPADQVAEGDRLYRSHIDWMKGTHHREGPKALLELRRIQDAGTLGPV